MFGIDPTSLEDVSITKHQVTGEKPTHWLSQQIETSLGQIICVGLFKNTIYVVREYINIDTIDLID